MSKNFDSAQYQIFRTSYLNISAKTNFLAKPLKPVYQGPRWVRFMKKNKGRKSCDTASLNRCTPTMQTCSTDAKDVTGMLRLLWLVFGFLYDLYIFYLWAHKAHGRLYWLGLNKLRSQERSIRAGSDRSMFIGSSVRDYWGIYIFFKFYLLSR